MLLKDSDTNSEWDWPVLLNISFLIFGYIQYWEYKVSHHTHSKIQLAKFIKKTFEASSVCDSLKTKCSKEKSTELVNTATWTNATHNQELAVLRMLRLVKKCFVQQVELERRDQNKNM